MKSDLFKSILSSNKSEQENAILHLYKYCHSKSRNLLNNYSLGEEFLKDAIQEAITITYTNIKSGRFKGLSSIETYTFSICKNLCINELKRNSQLKKTNFETTEENVVEVDKTRLSLLLSKISSTCSAILIKFYIEQKSLEELTKEYQLGSFQAMKNKKYRCMKKIMKIIQKHNFTFETFFQS